MQYLRNTEAERDSLLKEKKRKFQNSSKLKNQTFKILQTVLTASNYVIDCLRSYIYSLFVYIPVLYNSMLP